MSYHHVQWGRTWLLFLPLFLAVVISTSLSGSLTLTLSTLGFTLAVFFVLVYFQRLEVVIADDEISAAFGFGKPRRSYGMAEISDVSLVRTPWWYGFGVRKIPHGWMYNVWGLDGVELELEDGRIFRIGTDDADRLFGALELSLPRR